MPVHIATELELALPLDPIESALARLLEDHDRGDAELVVVIVDDAEIARLHVDFLGVEGPTDCLSFPLGDDDDDPELGEVYVSFDTAARAAAELGVSVADELLLYAVHGALHLVGYDDLDDESRARMRAAERRYAGRDGDSA